PTKSTRTWTRPGGGRQHPRHCSANRQGNQRQRAKRPGDLVREGSRAVNNGQRRAVAALPHLYLAEPPAPHRGSPTGNCPCPILPIFPSRTHPNLSPTRRPTACGRRACTAWQRASAQYRSPPTAAAVLTSASCPRRGTRKLVGGAAAGR